MTDVGKNIKNQRGKKNLSQEELAQRLGVTRQAVSSWENGKSQPDLDMLMKLAEILGVDVNEVLYGEKKEGTKAEQEHENEDTKEPSGEKEKADELPKKPKKKHRFLKFMILVLIILLIYPVMYWRMHYVTGVGATPSNRQQRGETEQLMGEWYQFGSGKFIDQLDSTDVYERSLQIGLGVFANKIQNVSETSDENAMPIDEYMGEEDTGISNYPIDEMHYTQIGGKDYACDISGSLDDILQLKGQDRCNKEDAMTETEIWYDIMTNSQYTYLIPESLYQQVIAQYGSVDTDRQCNSDDYSNKGIIYYPADCGMKNIDIDGTTYYYREDTYQKVYGVMDHNSYVPYGLFLHTDFQKLPEWISVAFDANIIPKDLFVKYYSNIELIQKATDEYIEYISQIGQEKFSEQWKETAKNEMKKLEQNEGTLTKYKYMTCEQWKDDVVRVYYQVTFSNGYVGIIGLADANGVISFDRISGGDYYGGTWATIIHNYLFKPTEISYEENQFFQKFSYCFNTEGYNSGFYDQISE